MTYDQKIPPFKWFILENFPYIEEDFDALTNWQLFCKLGKEMNKIIEKCNLTGEQVERLTTAFNELKEYVDNYFENLDVQDEINNKLDEMVEDGTFDELLAEYLNVLKETYFINSIEYGSGIIDDTEYYWAKVPYQDDENNRIVLKHGFAKNNDTATAIANETPREFAVRNFATFCVNASIFGIDENEENYHHAIGTIIKNGSLVSQYDSAGYTPQTQARMRMLGVKNDGSIGTYPMATTYEQFVANNVVNTFCGYGTAMENGVVDFDFMDEKNIWNFICQDTGTKDLLFICCNGRGIQGQSGLTVPQLLSVAQNMGFDYAFAIDSGGSTCYVENGIMVNEPYDNYGQTVRDVPDYIYFAKEPQTNIDITISKLVKNESDTSIKNKILKNELTYLGEIDNNYLDFSYPNIRHNTSAYSGVHLRYIKDGTVDQQLIFGTAENPKRLAYYDNENSKTVFSVNGATDKLQVGTNIFADFFTSAQNITDVDAQTSGGIFRIPGNVQGNPFGTGVGCILVVLNAPNGALQIAFAQTSNSTTKSVLMRTYNPSNQTWETWRILATPTAQ